MLKYELLLVIVSVNPPLNCLSVSLAFHSHLKTYSLPSSFPSCTPSYLSLSSSGYFCLFICLFETHMHTHAHTRTHKYSPSKEAAMHTHPNPGSILSSHHIPKSPQTLEFVMLLCSPSHLVTLWLCRNHKAYFSNCFLHIAMTNVLSHNFQV